MQVKAYQKELNGHTFYMADPDLWEDVPQQEVSITIPDSWRVASLYAEFDDREFFEVCLIRDNGDAAEAVGRLYDVKRLEDYKGLKVEANGDGIPFKDIQESQRGVKFSIQHGPFLVSSNSQRPF